MKCFICLLGVLAISLTLFANNSPAIDSGLIELKKAIANAPRYDAKRIDQIEQARHKLERLPSSAITKRFQQCEELYELFKVFQYDSAFQYARRMEVLALQLNDSSALAQANLKMAFVLLSSGMFKEAGDRLDKIVPATLQDAGKLEYYFTRGRYYYDLADYSADSYYEPQYIRQAASCIDSALAFCSKPEFRCAYYQGLKLRKEGNLDAALQAFKRLLDGQLTNHQVAIVASSLSAVYIQRKDMETAINLLIQAAIADIHSSTKETTAIFSLSELLFAAGDLKNASMCIEYAIDDAKFYGARQRKVQVSSILPIIESEKVNMVEEQKMKLIIYALIATFLLLALIVLAVIIFQQNKKLERVKSQLLIASVDQKNINNQLLEANKIKEEYIGYCFHTNSAYIHKIEKMKKQLEQKLLDKKTSEATFLVQNINIKQERDELFQHFDRIFLKIFPHFVKDFNALFREEDQVRLKDNELLNTDLRIFALIRLGIDDNEKIAQILEYSVNTIYTYKTKIKNKSMVSNDEFEERIMTIKAT
ncbi:DUF6377 domain-containing protein [Chitinophaga skermanii]|nr:DUF6377 domain-containing protein [Chitinophaga skermanii]